MNHILSRNRELITFVVAVTLSVFLVALYVFGASLMDSDSIGVGTTTVGAGLYVNEAFPSVLSGDAYIYGQLSLPYLVSTSTTDSSFAGAVGVATATPGSTAGVNFAVKDDANIAGILRLEDHLRTSWLIATSTTATSSTNFGLTIASSTVNIDGMSGRMAIGTSTIPDGDVANSQAVDPALSITGAGGAAGATGTLFIAGGGANGGQIIIKSSDGTHCVSIMAQAGANALDASGAGGSVTGLLTAKVVACPK